MMNKFGRKNQTTIKYLFKNSRKITYDVKKYTKNVFYESSRIFVFGISKFITKENYS